MCLLQPFALEQKLFMCLLYLLAPVQTLFKWLLQPLAKGHQLLAQNGNIHVPVPYPSPRTQIVRVPAAPPSPRKKCSPPPPPPRARFWTQFVRVPVAGLVPEHKMFMSDLHRLAPGVYWAIQLSWFARVNALCNLSRKKSREVAAHFRADFWVGVASRCV